MTQLSDKPYPINITWDFSTQEFLYIPIAVLCTAAVIMGI